MTFDDFKPVAEIVARQVHQQGICETPWELLSWRARSWMSRRAKRWLNTSAADCMTLEPLRERDPGGEVSSWMQVIGCLSQVA